MALKQKNYKETESRPYLQGHPVVQFDLSLLAFL